VNDLFASLRGIADFPAAASALMAEWPEFYQDVREMQAIAAAEGSQLDRLRAELAEQLQQRFASTATWGLEDWERELGITAQSVMPLEQRRAVVLSKIRGFGKFSGQLLKSVAQAYENGQIEVGYDPAIGTFTIRFVSTLGLPPNLADLKAAVGEVLPAHLLVKYVFRYLLVREVEGLKLQNLELRKLSDFAPFLEEKGK